MKTDFKTIKVEIKEGVGVFFMNNPPVNQLSDYFIKELAQAFSEAYEDAAVQAIVITGTGKNFIAGADITQVLGVKTKADILGPALEGTRFISSIETGTNQWWPPSTATASAAVWKSPWAAITGLR